MHAHMPIYMLPMIVFWFEGLSGGYPPLSWRQQALEWNQLQPALVKVKVPEGPIQASTCRLKPAMHPVTG